MTSGKLNGANKYMHNSWDHVTRDKETGRSKQCPNNNNRHEHVGTIGDQQTLLKGVSIKIQIKHFSQNNEKN